MKNVLILAALVMLVLGCADAPETPTPETPTPETPTPETPTPETPTPETPTCTLPSSVVSLEALLVSAWEAQTWPLAIQAIEQILVLDGSRGDMLENLYSAHINYGFQLYWQREYQQACEEFKSALQIKGAQQGLDMIDETRE